MVTVEGAGPSLTQARRAANDGAWTVSHRIAAATVTVTVRELERVSVARGRGRRARQPGEAQT